jgi:site-specific DNA-methyltransferase (adenine-specific)
VSELVRVSDAVTIILGDCREVLPVECEAVVCDPPYGLSFMGKKWDYDVPPVETWEACLRSLKPGGHLLAFAGTRTQHRMAVNIEDAGFEIRDMIAWVYGCLSEDTEVLTDKGWMQYHSARQERILAYDVQADIYQWEKPERWNEYRVESDTAFRIRGDHTDQIVSRGHRCLVERGGTLVFVPADELVDMERVPTLPDGFLGVPEGQEHILQPEMQRSDSGEGVGEARVQGAEVLEQGGRSELAQTHDGADESGVEGRHDVLPKARELQADQVRAVSCGVPADGAEGRVRHGTSAACCACHGEVPIADRSRTSREPQPAGQPIGEPGRVCEQRRPQTARARASYQTNLASVERVTYSGSFWCPTVSTGAFVARRNGKVFVTGNSGFPKSLDVSKAIDKAAGAVREVVGISPHSANRTGSKGSTPFVGVDGEPQRTITAPATPAARQWNGWGTALKPALEPITMARKPLEGTVAENVLAHGTGAINVDGCRVGSTEAIACHYGTNRGCFRRLGAKGHTFGARREYVPGSACPANTQTNGRWPANLIHDGSEEVVAVFPATGASRAIMRGLMGCSPFSGIDRSGKQDGTNGMRGHNDSGGSAARFFYSPKASRADRDDGNNHPTVKPVDLMRYLVTLVCREGGTVLDPFMGSGTTGIACIRTGRKFIGIERDASYFEIARQRLLRESAQPDIFFSLSP